MAKIELAKKITMRLLAGGDITAPAADAGDVSIGIIYGQAAGIRTGQGIHGEFVALRGNFKAIPSGGENVGKEIRSGELFLPDVALATIVPYVENAAKGETVVFAFEIGVRYDKASATKYVFYANSLLEPSEADPLSALENQIDLAGLLPAPVEAVDNETGEVKSNKKA